MISNLFNNLNAVDMWITGSIALSPVPCLFPSSVIFSLTNDLMLIFIYNFHLSDIMAFSGLLSKADKLTSSIIAVDSTMERWLFAKTGTFLFHHRALMVMNECIFMHAQTCIRTYVNTFNHLIYLQCKLWSQSYLFWVFPPNHQWLVIVSSALLPALLSDLNEHEQCVLMLLVSSKKMHNTDTICINFQMEGVKACSATVPVCLKSAKAL